MNKTRKSKKQKVEDMRSQVIDTLSKQTSELRAVLTSANKNKVYLPLGFKTFGAFLKDCLIKSGSDISLTYARRQANAGLVEIELFGIERIGRMKESALRPLFENVDKCNCKAVFNHARKKSKNEFPTAKEIVLAAKELKLYRQQKSKLKPQGAKDETSKAIANPKTTSKGSRKSEEHSGTVEFNRHKAGAEKTTNRSKSESSNVVPIKAKSSSTISQKLFKKYDIQQLKKIRAFLRAMIDENIKSECLVILKECNSQNVKILIKRLADFIAENEDSEKVTRKHK